MACVCGNGEDTEGCCGRFHSGAEWPSTAEELMRSRYAAFALGRPDYLDDTHDPETREPRGDALRLRWEKLEVLDRQEGGADDQEGWVEFKAHYRGGILHERSYFRRLKGRWVYTSGTTPKEGPLRRAESKVGRNEPCPCGSGRKHKHCCLKAAG